VTGAIQVEGIPSQVIASGVTSHSVAPEAMTYGNNFARQREVVLA